MLYNIHVNQAFLYIVHIQKKSRTTKVKKHTSQPIQLNWWVLRKFKSA